MNIFKRFFAAIKSLLAEASKDARKYIAVSLEITGTILQVISSKSVDLIISAITPEMEAHIPEIKKYLAQAIAILTRINDTDHQQGEMSDNEYLTHMLAVLLDELDKLNVWGHHALLSKLASILLGLLDGNQQKEHVYDTYIQNTVAASKL